MVRRQEAETLPAGSSSSSPHGGGQQGSESGEGVLKYRPADFLVDESIVVRPASREDAAVLLVRLKKCGYTTFEAVSAVAEFFGIARGDVGYAGLKDEDGVTEQLISLPLGLDVALLDGFNAQNSADAQNDGGERFMRVLDSGYGRDPMQIGRLNGNSFRLVVRGLGADVAARVRARAGKVNLFFINYYDTQRFGVPDSPKQTHLIGRALLEGDHDTAFKLLLGSGSAEVKAAAAFTGTPEEFFAELDPRTLSFYLCSHSSDLWNGALRAAMNRVALSEPLLVHRDGIPYVFAKRSEDVLALLGETADLPYEKYRWVDGEMRRSTSARPTVMQAQINIDLVEQDEFFPDHYACELSFFLPSGCYATTAVSQLFALLANDVPELSDAVNGAVQGAATGAVDSQVAEELDLTGRPAVWAAGTRQLWRRSLSDAMRDDSRDYAPPSAGVAELREVLRVELSLSQPPLVTAGVRAAVLGLAALGRRVFVEQPTYLGVPRTFERMGAQVTVCPLAEALAAVGPPEGGLIWLTSPGRNPDGWSLTPELIGQLSTFIDAGGLVVQNETYRWFGAEGLYVPGAIRVGSLSKLAGGWSRIGWLALPDDGPVPLPLAGYLSAATPPTHWQLAWARFAAAGGLAALRETAADAAAATAVAWAALGGVSAGVGAGAADSAGADSDPGSGAGQGAGAALGSGSDPTTPAGPSFLIRVPTTGHSPAAAQELARLHIRAGAGPDFGAGEDTARLCFLGKRSDDTLTSAMALLRDELNATAVMPGSPIEGTP